MRMRTLLLAVVLLSFCSSAAEAEPEVGTFAPFSKRLTCTDVNDAKALIKALIEGEQKFDSLIGSYIHSATPEIAPRCTRATFMAQVEEKISLDADTITYRGSLFRVGLYRVSQNHNNTAQTYLIYVEMMPGRSALFSTPHSRGAFSFAMGIMPPCS